MSDLTIVEGGKKGKGKGQKDEKPGLNKSQRKVLKIHDVANIVASGNTGIDLKVVDDGKGVRKLLLVNDNREVSYVEDELLVYNLINYTQKFMPTNEDYIWLPNDAVACCRIFKSKQAIPEPKKFAWQDDPDLCFKRLPFEFESKENYYHPYFDQLLENIVSDKNIFMDFIGSIFINESSNQNYLWAFGLGGDGKGSFFSILEHLLGETCASLNIPSPQDNHWGEFLIGKRLGIFSDVNNLTWTTSGMFKMLTGDDAIPINPKFQKHFSVKPRMKFIFASNFRPSITSMHADKRRLVFCEFKPVVREEYDNMAEKLIAEAQEIVNHCVKGYLKRYPKFTPLVSEINSKIVEEIAATTEEDFQDIFDKEIEIKKGWFVKPTSLNSVLRSCHLTTNKEKFVHFMETKHGIKKQTVRPISDGVKGNPIQVYKDIKLKNNNDLLLYSRQEN